MKKKTTGQKQVMKKEKFINHLFILTGILFFILGVWYVYNQYLWEDFKKNKMIKHLANKEISSELICMYGDEIQVKATISFLIGNETFYVCCERCQRRIMNNFHGSQFSIDLFSHERIRKSNAIIVLDKYNNGKVNYFESTENFKQFNNLNKSAK